MSFKHKIYAVVLLLIALAVFIGGAGIYAMNKMERGMHTALRASENVSRLKDLKSELQDVLINVREIVLAPEPGGRPGEKEELDRHVASIDARLQRAAVLEDSAALLQQLNLEWTKHKEIVNRIYTASMENNEEHAFQILMTECNPTRIEEMRLIGEVVANEEASSQYAVAAAETDYAASWWTMVTTCVAAVVIGLALSIFLVSRLNRSLSHSIESLRERAQDVERISGQLASASETLAGGATSQASALEETSSALEEMASVTRQNADNASETRNTTDKSLELISSGSQTVDSVIAAMNDIDNSSERTSEIIKTIEEIAFQTNLLALNAAVEAARAGEAGKGFAVVADEVRNLAIRSSDAAKSTSELIESTVEKVRHGSAQVRELAESFREIESESQLVGRLMGDISTATQEQAMGVDQVNTAVAQMDKVTQENAATAEESAAAASGLSEQSGQLNALVNELVGIVYGGSGRRINTLDRINEARRDVTTVVTKQYKQLGMLTASGLTPA